MTSQNNVPKKVEFKTRTTTLRKSLSTTNLGVILASHLNLRDSKSYTGEMQDNKSDSSEDNEISTDRFGENTYSPATNKIIETRDALTNEIIKIESGMLQQGGKNYSINEIAHIWKKDCRIWLWKNCIEFKKSRSIGEKLKAGIIKLKEYTI